MKDGENIFNFGRIARQMKEDGTLLMAPQPMEIAIPDAKTVMQSGLLSVIGDGYKWLPSYDKVAEWLENNHHKGLALIGGCGVGKTVIACHILPVLLRWYYGKVISQYDANELAHDPDKAMRWEIICIDDVGKEGEYNEYGNRRSGFSELVDRAEKEGKLLVITSNLTTQELTQKYGERTVDRLRGLCRCVIIENERSMRL